MVYSALASSTSERTEMYSRLASLASMSTFKNPWIHMTHLLTMVLLAMNFTQNCSTDEEDNCSLRVNGALLGMRVNGASVQMFFTKSRQVCKNCDVNSFTFSPGMFQSLITSSFFFNLLMHWNNDV